MSAGDRSASSRNERTITRVVLVFGAAAAGGLWYVLSSLDAFEALLFPGLLSLAVVTGLIWFGRIRTRERWEAAWEAYVAQEI